MNKATNPRKFVIVDIDGTVSLVGDRVKYINEKPKQWQKFLDACGEDQVNQPILNLVRHLNLSYHIVFCTARSEKYREITHEWLTEVAHMISPIVLMRPLNDDRSDTVVKPELVANFGLVPDNTAYILEDRRSVAEKWRELGFTCLQVADGEF